MAKDCTNCLYEYQCTWPVGLNDNCESWVPEELAGKGRQQDGDEE